MYKFIFYVPLENAEAVKNAVFQTGAGSIGEYANCAYEIKGVGQFRPIGSANPHIGEKGSLERVEELRVEILCEEENAKAAIHAMIKAHPYEEPAWEIIKIENSKFL